MGLLIRLLALTFLLSACAPIIREPGFWNPGEKPVGVGVEFDGLTLGGKP